MADNRMWLVHEASGQRVLLAKDFRGVWDVFVGTGDTYLVPRLARAFEAEAEQTSAGFASTGWRLEYEHDGR